MEFTIARVGVMLSCYCTLPYPAMPYHAMPNPALPYLAMPCHAMPYSTLSLLQRSILFCTLFYRSLHSFSFLFLVYSSVNLLNSPFLYSTILLFRSSLFVSFDSVAHTAFNQNLFQTHFPHYTFLLKITSTISHQRILIVV